MKLAYRIITPIFAIGAVVMGLMLKLFYFAIGGLTDEIGSIVTLVEQFGVKTKYEFSAIEIIQMLMGADLSGASSAVTENATEEAVSFLTIAEPIIPHLIAFVVFFIIALGLFIATGVMAAIKDNRKPVMIMSVTGLVICFICIVIGRLAFDKIIGGEINLADVVGMFSESTWTQLLAAAVTIKTATLSAGFYAVFGMYILVIFWTVLANMLIKTPIQVEKKHRRKKPLPRASAILKR